MKLGQIAKRLDCELEGDASIEITGVAGIDDAHPGELTFLANRRYAGSLATTRASAIVVDKSAGPLRIATLRSENPYLDFARAIELFYEPPRYAPAASSYSTSRNQIKRLAARNSSATIGRSSTRSRKNAVC